MSIHRSFTAICPKSYIGPKAYVESILRVNHYLGSWEEYNARIDTGSKWKNRTIFNKTANANEGPLFEIRSWLRSFMEEVGPSKALSLLKGVGECESSRDRLTGCDENKKNLALFSFLDWAANSRILLFLLSKRMYLMSILHATFLFTPIMSRKCKEIFTKKMALGLLTPVNFFS